MIEEQVTFGSDGLWIEGRLSYSETIQTPKAKVLLSPPHPFLGGDMQNNVITHLNSALAEEGYLVLSFNYRGIGNSESNRNLQVDQQAFWDSSSCPEYESEMYVDCQSALKWLQDQLERQQPVLAIGYSFGCLPTLKMTRAEDAIAGCLLISPPLNKWPVPIEDVQFKKPKGVFYSPGDFACDTNRLQMLFDGMSAPKALFEIENADHFFIKKEQRLGEQVISFLSDI